MSLRRCCSLLSTARPVGRIATDLTARLMSRANRDLGRRSSRANDRAPVAVAVEPPDPIASSHRAGTDNGGGYVAIPSRRNANVFSSVSATPRPEIIADSRDDDDDDYLDDRDVTLPKALDRCIEDVSDVGPHLTPTFTFAKYANESRTIQELVKLGVGLYKFETQEDMVQYILGLDFDHDVKPYIRFLHDCGVPADQLGHFITKNPNIFKEDMDDLHTRIRYLRAHQFSVQMISAIICKNPNWLMFSTKDIDGRLGYFQSNFALNGGEVRLLSIKGPKVITYRMVHLFENTFSVKEEMGFDKRQSKQLLLRLPRLWTKNRRRLVNVFEYAHDEMQLPHDILAKSPNILLCRKTRLQQRHMFLVELKKAQYDPTKPLYVSPQILVSGTDVDFCRDVAKTSIDVYNEFLKTF